MILTGSEIRHQISRGTITIDPFHEEDINPNSINYHLGGALKCYRGSSADGVPEFDDAVVPGSGYALLPGRMYLGHTREVIGSSEFAMSLIGRSSIGRLGLFLQISADLGHTTSCHRWTLELVASKAIIVYPGMTIGQVSFWVNNGDVERYTGAYGNSNTPTESRLLPAAKEEVLVNSAELLPASGGY